MKLFLNRLLVSFKRSLISPYVYILASVLIALALVSALMPEKKSSAYIPIAILNLDESVVSSMMIEDLQDVPSVFTFYEVDSEEELYDDLMSGRADTGFIFPEDLIENSGSFRRIPDIREITTPSSTLPLMSSEEIFAQFFVKVAPNILKQIVEDSDVDFPDGYEQTIDDIYDQYMNGNTIYRLESLVNNEYDDITVEQKIAVPVYKFAGFFIWMAALLGTLCYLNDTDNKLYLRMTKPGRVFMGLILPAVHVLPVAVVSVISFVIAGIDFSLPRVFVYCVGVTLLAFIVAFFFAALPGQGKKSRTFSAILPTYLILSFVFGGVMFDLAVYSSVVRGISMFFPPYLF